MCRKLRGTCWRTRELEEVENITDLFAVWRVEGESRGAVSKTTKEPKNYWCLNLVRSVNFPFFEKGSLTNGKPQSF